MSDTAVACFKALKRYCKVIYRNQTTIETSTVPAICIFKRANPIIYFIFQYSGKSIYFVALSPNRVKRAQGCISSIKDDRKIEFNI